MKWFFAICGLLSYLVVLYRVSVKYSMYLSPSQYFNYKRNQIFSTYSLGDQSDNKSGGNPDKYCLDKRDIAIDILEIEGNLMPQKVSNPAKIIITDDHTVIRSTLRDWLCDEYPGLKVFEASSGENTLALLASEDEPDLVLMDFHLPGITGIETTREISREYPQIPIILLTIQEDRLYADRAIEAGAKGYVIKRKMYSDLLPAISAVLSGEVFSSM